MRIHRILCAMAVAMAPATVLLASSAAHAQAPSAASRTGAPSATGFNVEEVSSLEPGNQLHFDLYGTPGATVSLSIDGATRGLQLSEVEPGQYAGSYTIGERDRLRPDSRVRADMRLGSQSAAVMLTKSLVRGDVPLATAQGSSGQGSSGQGMSGQDSERPLTPNAGAPGLSPPPPPRATERPRVARYCTSCAIVEKVEVIQGTSADARPLATEAQARQRYRVTVRFNTSDATQAIEYDNNPGYRKGDRVRVNNGVLALERE